MSKIIIIGDGETAELACEYFTHDSPHDVVAFSVEQEYLKKQELFGLPIIPFEDLTARYDPAEYVAFVAISYTQLNRVRARLYQETKRKGYSLVSYVSSKAFVWRNVEIGENCFILENNVLQYAVKIGNNVVLWSGNHVGHQTIIRDNVFVSSHVVISGYCDIGENCFLGVNSSLANNLTIAKDCLIGMGAVVNKNTEARQVYVGNPAKPLGKDTFAVYGVRE
ncbi:MAG TPA: acetyltransferase [Pyrinomonadaceae bacterium]|jgi:sugar O-acyltransferase (sialic acid O-acetyltransferase NeuD family)|nr:acetyltransferase [Pyrinomonadaceae bacterium]